MPCQRHERQTCLQLILYKHISTFEPFFLFLLCSVQFNLQTLLVPCNFHATVKYLITSPTFTKSHSTVKWYYIFFSNFSLSLSSTNSIHVIKCGTHKLQKMQILFKNPSRVFQECNIQPSTPIKMTQLAPIRVKRSVMFIDQCLSCAP